MTNHTILLDTLDTAIGVYIDKIARALHIQWGDKMPGSALENWSEINEVDENTIKNDIDRWKLARPLGDKKNNVLAFSFSGIRTFIECIVERNITDFNDEDKKSLGRAAQILIFEHVADKTVRGIKATAKQLEGTLVVSGGVACNLALRNMYLIS